MTAKVRVMAAAKRGRSGTVLRIGGAILGEFKPQSRGRGLDPRHLIAVRELELLIRHRRGSRAVDAAEEEAFFRAASARLLAHAGAEAGLKAALGWAVTFCPRLVAEHGPTALLTIARRYAGRPPHKPETLGTLLAVAPAERQDLRLTKIRYAGQDDARLRTDQRRRHAERMRAVRQETGATPRELSASRTQPWLAAGFRSRRTWERHGKPPSAETGTGLPAEAGREVLAQTRAEQSFLRKEALGEGAWHEFAPRTAAGSDSCRRTASLSPDAPRGGAGRRPPTHGTPHA